MSSNLQRQEHKQKQVRLLQSHRFPEYHEPSVPHANVAGRVLGAGRLDISNGSRRILGTQGDATYTDTSFKQLQQIFKLVDTNTSPSTIHQRLSPRLRTTMKC